MRESIMRDNDHDLTTTRSDTRTVTIDAPVEQVFDFVADPENLPRWAVGFCRAIRRDPEGANGRWIVTTPHGDVPVRYVSDRALGVIDFHLTVAPGVEAAAFSRVVANGEGAEYIFTQFQGPQTSDEIFEGQVRALVEELSVLRSLIRARGVCPA
jgi:hypothetical protein